MSNMVLGQAPAARVLPLARGAREGGLVVTDRPNFQVSFTRERVPKSAAHTQRHATFEPPAHTNYHYQIPASFEQTQRVPTGHPDVCLCDVSGATNY